METAVTNSHIIEHCNSSRFFWQPIFGPNIITTTSNPMSKDFSSLSNPDLRSNSEETDEKQLEDQISEDQESESKSIDNLTSTAHKNIHSPFPNHPLKDGNRREPHSHTSQHHITMTSDVESGLNQSGFDKSSPITQSASAHLGTHLNSSSPNFEVSRNSAGISRNSTPETVQTQIQQIQPSFSPDVSANAETLTSVSPAKTPTSKHSSKSEQIEELDLTKLTQSSGPASLDLLQKVMLEKYFQSFASSLNDSSTNCATNPAAGFLGGVQPPNGCQNLFATSPGAQKQQDPRQNQQLVQQMQNCLLQIAAASANPGSLFQFASSPQNNFYLNTYNFLLQNPYANILNPLGVPQNLLSPLANYLSKLPAVENTMGASQQLNQPFPNFKPDTLANPLLNPSPGNPFLSNILGNSGPTYPLGLGTLPNTFPNPLNPNASAPLDTPAPFWNHGSFIPTSSHSSQKRSSASETPDMQNELPEKHAKLAKNEPGSEHGMQNDKGLKLGAQNGMSSLETSTTYRHRCKFCKKPFGSDSALQIHIRSHTGERPFKCNICGNRFTTKGNLKVHFQRHKAKYPTIEMNPNPVPEYLDASFPALLASMPEYPSEAVVDLPPKKEFDFPPPFEGFDKNFPSLKDQDSLLHNERQFQDSANSIGISQIVKLKSVVKNAAAETASKVPNDFLREKSEKEQAENNLKQLENNSDTENESSRQPIGKGQCNNQSNEATFVFDERFDDEPINLSISCSEPNRSAEIDTLAETSDDNNGASMDEANGEDESCFEASEETPFQASSTMEISTSKEKSTTSEMSSASSETMKLQALVDNIESKLGIPSKNQTSSQNSAVCSICHKILSCKSALKIHYRIHTGERPYSCEICHRRFSSRGNMKLHVETHKQTSPLLHGNLCSSSSSSQMSQLQRMSQQNQCHVCYKHFDNCALLDSHMREHNVNNTYKGQRSNSPSPSIVQVRMEEASNASYTPNSELNQNDSDEKIDMILKSGSDTGTFLSVNEKLIKVEKLSNQRAASASFESSSSHDVISNSQSNLSSNLLNVGNSASNSKQHVCKTCSKPFSSASALQIHTRTHTGDKPYKCAICQRAFTTKGNLKVHMGTHVYSGPSRRGRRTTNEMSAASAHSANQSMPGVESSAAVNYLRAAVAANQNSLSPNTSSLLAAASSLFPIYNTLHQDITNMSGLNNVIPPFEPNFLDFPNSWPVNGNANANPKGSPTQLSQDALKLALKSLSNSENGSFHLPELQTRNVSESSVSASVANQSQSSPTSSGASSQSDSERANWSPNSYDVTRSTNQDSSNAKSQYSLVET